jgi:hypothetical protein
MPMTLLIETNDGISEFALVPIERKGKKTKRIAVDSEGRQCKPMLMTHDRHLLSSGSTALLYDDGNGNTIDRSEIVETDEHGNVLRTLPSIICRPQRLSESVQPEELLDHVIQRAYALTPITLTSDLKEMLADGCIFRVPFRPRASSTDNPAFILSNSNGIFLLQGKQCRIGFVTLEQSITIQDEDEDDESWDEAWEYDRLGGEEW